MVEGLFVELLSARPKSLTRLHRVEVLGMRLSLKPKT